LSKKLQRPPQSRLEVCQGYITNLRQQCLEQLFRRRKSARWPSTVRERPTVIWTLRQHHESQMCFHTAITVQHYCLYCVRLYLISGKCDDDQMLLLQTSGTAERITNGPYYYCQGKRLIRTADHTTGFEATKTYTPAQAITHH
jgi:hypothetical protein